MKRTFAVPRLDRVVAVLDGSAKLENPYDVQNLRLQGYDYWMRYGYTTIQPKQTNFQAVYGLGWSQGVSQISTESLPTPKEEVVTIEGIGSPEVIRPYSRMVLNPVNTTTFAPTQIGTTTLTNGKWGFASYNDYIYAICPGADKLTPPKPTVYKHLIGETTGVNAWVTVQDSSYVNTTGGITNIIVSQPTSRKWTTNESSTGMSVTVNTNLTSPYTFTNLSGTVRVVATSSVDNGRQGAIRVQCIFDSNIDVTRNDYIAVRIKTVVGGAFEYLQNFYGVPNADKPVLRLNGVDQNPEYRLFVNEDGTQLVIYMYIEGLTDRDKLQRVTFSAVATCGDGSNIAVIDILPFEIGGIYLNATTSGKRLWDNFDLDGLDGSANGVNYATRYKTGGTYSTATIVNATKAQMTGFITSPAPYMGARLNLSATQNLAWTDIEFLRQQVGGTWKILATKPNSGTDFSVIDTYQENELTSLTTATGVTGTSPTPTPTFRTAGIVGAFPYKQSMVWLVNQTSQNIQFSRVGDPLELFDSARTYNSLDNTVPAQYTLADDQADVPVWGTQAGVSAFIIGKYAAYAMVGDYPSAMSPSRQIPGSRGIVGCYAGTRFRSAQGIWGAAYADADLNIWVVNSVPAFVEDASAKPQEISLPIRGKLKDFLYTQQKLEISNLDITNTKLVFEEEESSLWVMLGKRAAVFRQDMVGNGWELYDYTMSSSGVVAVCTEFFTNNATATEANPGDDTGWTNVGLPFSSDDAYAISGTIPKGNNKETHYLRCFGYIPSPLIPANATITSIKFLAEDSKVGDLGVTNVHAQPIQASTGTTLGTNQATGRSLTDAPTDATQQYTSSALQTLANLNSGLIGIDLKYRQEDWDTNWDNPAYYTVVITPTSPQVKPVGAATPYITNYTVTVTYTAGGAKPPYAFVNLTGQTTCSGDIVATLGYGTTNNGLGESTSYAEGNIGTLPAIPPDLPTVYTISTNTTKRQKVTLTAGVGTYNVTMTSTNEGLPPTKWTATHTLTGTFSEAIASYVKVDNVATQICYTVISTGTNVQWSQVNFSPNGKYLGFRSTGELDIIEKDFRTGVFIGGTNRDSGLVPSNWFFTTQQIQWDGAKARLASVQYHGQNYTDVVNVGVSVDNSAYVSGTLEGVQTSRWYKFHPSVSSGIRHNVKITGNESDASLKGYTLEFSVQSRGKPR